jgi:hypothetical protein
MRVWYCLVGYIGLKGIKCVFHANESMALLGIDWKEMEFVRHT